MIRWIENIDIFIKIKDDWDKAIDLSNTNNPFLLSDFIINWWKIYYKDYKLKIFILEDCGMIKGGLPLYIKSQNLKLFNYKCLTFIGDSFANVTNPFYLVKKEIFEENFIHGLRKLKGWDMLDLQRIRMRFLDINSSCLIRNNSLNFNIRETDTNLFIHLNDEFKTPEEYLSTRGVKLRRNTHSFYRKAELIGNINLTLAENKKSVIDHLKKYHAFTVNSRILRNKKSEFEDNNKRYFLENLIIALYENDKIELLALQYNDEIAGYAIGYKVGNGFNWAFTSYNPKFSKISPGYVLIFKLIEFSINNQYSYIDFYYGGNAFYKQQWSNFGVFLRKVKIFNRTFKGYLTYHLLNFYYKFSA
jgi:CelD/BcsL family acetyltransferase involved in cellulose biosynthesis